MSIGSIFTDIATGIGSFMPALAKGIFDAFVGLFISYTEMTADGVTTVTYSGLNPLGIFAIVALVIGICYKVLPMAYNFIVKRARARKARKARA